MIIYPVSNTDQKRRGLTYKVFVEQLIAVLLILTVFAGHTYSRGVYCTVCRGVYIAVLLILTVFAGHTYSRGVY